jgi:hypothetical protein
MKKDRGNYPKSYRRRPGIQAEARSNQRNTWVWVLNTIVLGEVLDFKPTSFPLRSQMANSRFQSAKIVILVEICCRSNYPYDLLVL